jgi:hypothetical protein
MVCALVDLPILTSWLFVKLMWLDEKVSAEWVQKWCQERHEHRSCQKRGKYCLQYCIFYGVSKFVKFPSASIWFIKNSGTSIFNILPPHHEKYKGTSGCWAAEVKLSRLCEAMVFAYYQHHLLFWKSLWIPCHASNAANICKFLSLSLFSITHSIL